MGKIKVLILFSSGDLGGAERSLSRMAIANRCDDVTYLLGTMGGAGSWSEWVLSLNWDPIVFSVLSDRGFALRNLIRMARKIRRLSPDVVYVVGIRAAVIVRLMRPFLGRFKIVHGIRTTFQSGSSLARRFGVPEKLLQGLTDGYIANSEAGRASFSKLVGLDIEMIHLIPNGVDIPIGMVVDDTSQRKSVVVVANLHPLKGHREFLRVVSLVYKEHPDVKFVFVGRDDMSGEIQQRASQLGLSSVVQFVGFQPEVWKWLRSAKVFALPSRLTEGAPTSIIEAQGVGLPVVAFKIGGVSDLIREGVDGYLIAPGDDAGMAAGISALLHDAHRSRQMGENGRIKVLSSFSTAISADRHAQVWRELLGLCGVESRPGSSI